MSQYIPIMRRVMPLSVLRVLLLVQGIMVIPFLFYLPLWLGVVFLLVLLWRWRVTHGEMRQAPRSLIVLAMLVGVSGLLLSGLRAYNLDSAVALCVLGYLLKSLEVMRRRDGIFQAYLGYFLTGIFLLYNYTPVGALVAILMVLGNTLSLHAVTADQTFRWRRGLKLSGALMAAAVPIMIVGFLFFPRLPPLWSIPNDERGAQTGMSDTVEPGSIEALAENTSPAFRVQFEGDRPPRQQWYWRGTTLGDFDGRAWRANYRDRNRFQWPQGQLPRASTDASQYDYSVLLEATQQHWLYFLDWPTQIRGEEAFVLPDGRAARRNSLSQNYRYEAQSASRVTWNGEASLAQYLRLPETGNEALRQWGLEQRAAAGSDAAYVQAILAHIRNESFRYTLRPPLYPSADSLSDFWFGDRAGFCSHYASAVAYLARAADIPSRLVGGYLGGTYNDSGDFIQVRQMEAHAWVEVWLDGQWQRIDPTAAVAPGRIEANLDDWLSQDNPSDLPFGVRFGRNLSAFNDIRFWWDSVQYQWQVSVLNYQQSNAMGLLEARFGRIDPWHAAAAMAVFLGSLGLLMAWFTGILKLPRRVPEPWASLRRVEREYGTRRTGETVSDYLQRLAMEHPQRLEPLARLAHLIDTLAYDPQVQLNSLRRRELKHNVDACLS
jgi:transglutaminase-like putative cysteine protease